MPERVEVTRDGRVARVALDRPEKRNALSAALCRALADALDEAAADPEVGAILLTGKGKAFCAGMDLGEILEADTGAIDAVHERLFTSGLTLDKPLVGAVQGAALGGGAGLAANCHVVVAADDAVFGLTEIRIGLWPFLVFRAVAAAAGERRAVELALTGRVFGAAEAREYGLVHHVAADHLAGHAAELAANLAQASPVAVRNGLAYVAEARGKSAAEAGEIARRYRAPVLASAEFREAVRAFREKKGARQG